MDRAALAGLVSELSLALRDEVLPALGGHEGREHVSGAAQGSGGGDVTFAVDERAESFLEVISPSVLPTSRSTPRTGGWSLRVASPPGY